MAVVVVAAGQTVAVAAVAGLVGPSGWFAAEVAVGPDRSVAGCTDRVWARTGPFLGLVAVGALVDVVVRGIAVNDVDRLLPDLHHDLVSLASLVRRSLVVVLPV